MKDETFKKVLAFIVAAGLFITIAHTVYAIYAYEHSSIIHFVSKEWW